METLLTNISNLRDEVLFLFIKPYWPRRIIPNHITYVRLVIGVGIFILLFFFGVENKLLIVSLFCIGLVTDVLDGSVARGTGRVTTFGAMLDSVSDRVLIVPIAAYSLYADHKWMLLCLLLAEAVNAIFSLYYNTREIYLESNIFGKTKMVIASLVLVVILYLFPNPPPLFFIIILWLTIPISFLSIFSKIMELREKNHGANQNI